jgi:epoxyqueuosine reductase
MKKLLLHTCCAPCLIFPLERLRASSFEVTAYFYNPNIHGYQEFLKRKEAVDVVANSLQLETTSARYKPQEFFQALNSQVHSPNRCGICWTLRLAETAALAKAQSFDFFSTTLLVSPYQDQEALKMIGARVGQEQEIEFYYEDFRPGFRRAHTQAKAQGIYCQKYCGCIFSEIERFAKNS